MGLPCAGVPWADSTLFFSPWLFGTGEQTTIGLFNAVLAVAALAAFTVWEEWFSLIARLWLIGLPRLLGFEDSDAITLCVNHRRRTGRLRQAQSLLLPRMFNMGNPSNPGILLLFGSQPNLAGRSLTSGS
jgi:hypothetical protein